MSSQITFSPLAWAKMQAACVLDARECGFYGITPKDSIFTVNDLYLPKQEVSGTSVSFDDEDVSAYFADYGQRGFIPRQLTTVWIHRHPGIGLTPSNTDENTFNTIIGQQDAAIMVIFDTGKAAAWLQINRLYGQPYKMRTSIECVVDYTKSFDGFDLDAFSVLFKEKVAARTFTPNYNTGGYGQWIHGVGWSANQPTKEDAAIVPVKQHQFGFCGSNVETKGGILFCDTCKTHLDIDERNDHSLMRTCLYCNKEYRLCFNCEGLERHEICDRCNGYGGEF